LSESTIDHDWVNLGQNASSLSLWDCLHDADIISLETDPLHRTAVIAVNVFYINGFHGLPEDFRFFIELEGVSATRSITYRLWPGKFERPENISREEETKLVNEYQQKGREETMSWQETETLITTGEFRASDASIAKSSEGLTLNIYSLRKHDSKVISLFIRATNLSVSRSDGIPCDLEKFISLGERYWEEFSKRKSRYDIT